MGYSISWIAARAPASDVCDRLGLRPTGEQVEIPEAPIAGARLSTGWYLVVAARCDHPLITGRSLGLVSAEADVVACSIEEHVMYSQSSFWSGGGRVWSIAHDAQRSIDHLEVSGELPPFFGEIRNRRFGEQSAQRGAAPAVDFVFDVPLEVAQRLVGFKHDVAGGPESFDVLEPINNAIKGPAKRWWKFW